MEYIWRIRKRDKLKQKQNKRRIHIANSNGSTFCQIENHSKKYIERSEVQPSNTLLCRNCVKLQARCETENE